MEGGMRLYRLRSPVPRRDGRSSPSTSTGTPAPTVYELLARFWKHPLPNPGAGRSRPLDGLPDAAERDRAERAGWVTREFTLSLDAAVELIGRGVPFLVTLVEAGFSQPRLCVGADAVRGTVFLADGLDRRPVEAPGRGWSSGSARSARGAWRSCPPRSAAKLDSLDARRRPGPRGALRGAEAAADARPRRPRSRPRRGCASSSPATRWRRSRNSRWRATTRTRSEAARVLRRAPRRASARVDVGAVEGGRAARPEPDARAARAAGGRGDRRSTPSRSSCSRWRRCCCRCPHRQEEAASAAAAVGAQPADGRGRVLPARDAVVGGPAVRRGGRGVPLRVHAGRPRGSVRRGVLPRRPRHRAGAGGAAAVPAEGGPRRRARSGRDARALFHALMDRDEPAAGPRRARPGDQETARAGGSKDRQRRGTAPRRRRLGELLLFRAECHAGGRAAFGRPTPTSSRPEPLVPPVAWHKAAARVARIKPDLATAGCPLPRSGEARPALARSRTARSPRSWPTPTAGPRRARTSPRRVSGSRTTTRC